MNTISVAIPTFNPSSFLEELLLNLSKLNHISEIVINDDNSANTEFYKTKDIVDKFSNYSDIKVLLDRNSKNYGTFYNKYITVEKCSSNFVFQIDQDNLPHKKMLKNLLKTKTLNKHQDDLFLASTVYPFRFDNLKESRFNKNRIVFFNRDTLLNKKEIVKMIKEKTPMKSPNHNINYIIGTGNPFFYKEAYLSNLKEGLNDDQDNIHCSVALCYYWLKNGGHLFFPKEFSLYHRKHENSYYQSDPRAITSSEKIDSSADTYFKKILAL